MGEPGQEEARRWPRAVGLSVVTLSLTVLQPVLLVAVPFALLAVAVPGKRLSSIALAGIALVLAFGEVGGSGLWYVERGWSLVVGGWFVASTLMWPRWGVTARGLAAVAGGGAWVGALFLLWPEGWTVTDWVISDRIVQGSSATLETLRLLQDGGALPAPLVEAVHRASELQGRVFPALLALSSLSALGVAWWLYVRLSFGRDDGLGPLAGFRFHDQLVWLLIAGIVLLLWGWGDQWSRLGENVVVFMGALYAMRGLAVVLAITGGISALGWLFGALVTLFAAPMVVAAAFALGLGDTWLDLRDRFRSDGADPDPSG